MEDAGAKYLSALCAVVKAGKERDATVVRDMVVDPAGYFYRFTQPSSILGSKKAKRPEEG